MKSAAPARGALLFKTKEIYFKNIYEPDNRRVPRPASAIIKDLGDKHLRFVMSGGAGFIGSHLCDRLLAEGHSVLVLDNLITGSRANIEHLTDHPRFEFRDCDVTQRFTVEGAVDGALHLASLASPKDYVDHP